MSANRKHVDDTDNGDTAITSTESIGREASSIGSENIRTVDITIPLDINQFSDEQKTKISRAISELLGYDIVTSYDQNVNKYIDSTKEQRPVVTAVRGERVSSKQVNTDAVYDSVANQLEDEARTFRQQVAARLLPALKTEMKQRDHGTYAEKVELVRWVNAELDRFSIAFKHPKTGEAAVFKAKSFDASHPEIGHFQLSSKGTDGREKTFNTPDLAKLLDTLELIDAPARREALAEWQTKVGRERRGAKRG